MKREGLGIVVNCLWTWIPVNHWVPPLLHIFLGIMNDIIDKFFLWVAVRILQLDEEQLDTLLQVEIASDILNNKIAASDQSIELHLEKLNQSILERIICNKKAK